MTLFDPFLDHFWTPFLGVLASLGQWGSRGPVTGGIFGSFLAGPSRGPQKGVPERGQKWVILGPPRAGPYGPALASRGPEALEIKLNLGYLGHYGPLWAGQARSPPEPPKGVKMGYLGVPARVPGPWDPGSGPWEAHIGLYGPIWASQGLPGPPR